MHAPSQPFDAITAFAVPNPNCSSQSRRFFQVWLLFGLPRGTDHSAYFGLAKFYLSQPFQPSTEANLESCSKIVNARFQCNRPVAMGQEPETQPVESLSLNEWAIKFLPFSHRNIHRRSKARTGTTNKECVREPCKHLDSGKSVTHGGYRRIDAMANLVAYIDGGSRGNPGPSGIGVVIDGSTDGTIRIAKRIGHQDNNVAEYLALLEALQCALGLKAKALHVFSDSEVVVRQMSGEYSCRSPRLYSLNWICRKLARSLDFSISHVRREHNTEANGLASSAARRKLC
jgi:ribonuclease HI